jgi:hypothetical protein
MEPWWCWFAALRWAHHRVRDNHLMISARKARIAEGHEKFITPLSVRHPPSWLPIEPLQSLHVGQPGSSPKSKSSTTSSSIAPLGGVSWADYRPALASSANRIRQRRRARDSTSLRVLGCSACSLYLCPSHRDIDRCRSKAGKPR